MKVSGTVGARWAPSGAPEETSHLAGTRLCGPSSHRLAPPPLRADGLEPPTDFLGDSEFALDLLLPPSPAPPVEDSSGSGTATLSGPPPLAHPFQQQHSVQQHIMVQHQPQQHHQQQATMPALPPGYVLAANGAGALPVLDLSAVSASQQGGVPLAEQYAMQPSGYQQAPLQQMPSGGMGGQLVLPTLSALRVDSCTHRTTTGAPSASDAPTATHTNSVGPDGKRRRGPRPRIFKKHACQADGCAVDLAPLSFYLQRNHICPVGGRQGAGSRAQGGQGRAHRWRLTRLQAAHPRLFTSCSSMWACGTQAEVPPTHVPASGPRPCHPRPSRCCPPPPRRTTSRPTAIPSRGCPPASASAAARCARRRRAWGAATGPAPGQSPCRGSACSRPHSNQSCCVGAQPRLLQLAPRPRSAGPACWVPC